MNVLRRTRSELPEGILELVFLVHLVNRSLHPRLAHHSVDILLEKALH